MKESDIIHESGDYWVCREKKAYTVYKNEGTHAVSFYSFRKDEAGKSLAIAYCDRAKRVWEWF